MTRPTKNKNDIWQTRISVPKELRGIIGASELKKSLRTKNETEAKLKHSIVMAEFQASIEQARAKLESESKLSDAVIDCIIFEWRKDTATLLGANPNASNPFLSQNFGIIEENNIPVIMVLDDLNNLESLKALRQKEGRPLDPDIIEKKQSRYFAQLEILVSGLFSDKLASYHIVPDVNGKQYRKLLTAFSHVYIELTQSALKKKVSDLDLLKHGATLTSTAAELSTGSGDTFEDVWADYQNSTVRRDPKRGQARIKDYASSAGKFMRTYPNKDIRSFTKRDIAAFRNIVEQLPTRPKASIGKLTLSEQIEKAVELGLDTTAPAGVRKQINALSAVFNYAVQQGVIDVNPVQGSVTDIKKVKVASDGRGYSPDELKRIFSSEIFSPNYKMEKATYGNAYYWLPLLLNYTGARAEEVAQLYVEDINMDADIPFIRIHGERADQSVKTDEPRNVPIHQHLLELGLVEYIQSLPVGSRLFPLLNINSKGKYHTNFGKWFANYIRKDLNINREGLQPLHGFRHAFITSCRERNVRMDVQKSITGHSHNDVASQYGNYSLAMMNEIIQSMPRCM